MNIVYTCPENIILGILIPAGVLVCMQTRIYSRMWQLNLFYLPLFFSSYLSHLLGDGGQAFVLWLGVGEDITGLAELRLQLQDPLLVIGLLTHRLLDQRLLPAFPVCSHLLMVGVDLPKRLERERLGFGELAIFPIWNFCHFKMSLLLQLRFSWGQNRGERSVAPITLPPKIVYPGERTTQS